MNNNMGGLQNILNMFSSGGMGNSGNNIFAGIKKFLNGGNNNSGNRRYRCNYKILTMEEAYVLIMSENCKILDVRTENEYKLLRIKGAINIPVEMLASNVCNILPNKSENILIYCATGPRAAKAIQILANMGYINTFIWEGAGINNFKYKDIIIDNTNMNNSNSGNTTRKNNNSGNKGNNENKNNITLP